MDSYRAALVAIGLNEATIKAWGCIENQLYLLDDGNWPHGFYNDLPDRTARYKRPGAQFMVDPPANDPSRPSPFLKVKTVDAFSSPAYWNGCTGALILINVTHMSVQSIDIIEHTRVRKLVGEGQEVRTESLGGQFNFNPDFILDHIGFTKHPAEAKLLERMRSKLAMGRRDENGKGEGLPVNDTASRILLRNGLHQSYKPENDFVVGSVVILIGTAMQTT